MATWEDTLIRSRFHSDRAEYKEAAAILREFLNTGPHRLEAVLELSRVVKTQGYWRDALEIILSEANTVADTEAGGGPLGVRMKMEVCLLKMFVTASFDAPLQEAEELRVQSANFAALGELEPETIHAALCHSKIRFFSCQYHQPCAAAELEALVSWLRPGFDRLLSLGRHREAYDLLQAYGSSLKEAPKVGVTTLDYETWSQMVQQFLSSSDLPPLFKANAMVLLASKASERLGETYLDEIEMTAKSIYEEQGHAVGAMDVRFQQINRALKKDHNYLTEELFEELKGYFSRYQASDAIASYENAIQAVLAPLPEWKLFDLQVTLSHEKDELAQRTGTKLITQIARTGLIGRWLAHSGKAASCVEAAEAIDATLKEGDCKWLRGMMPHLASHAYAQLQDHQKAYGSAVKAFGVWQGTSFNDAAAASATALLQAKLNLHEQGNPSLMSMADILSFADTQITRDIENGFISHATEKAGIVLGHRNQLQPEQRRYWMKRSEECVQLLSESSPQEGDIRMAGLHQSQAVELLASVQSADSEAWEQCLARLDKAVALLLKHSRLLEAANTRHMQSCAYWKRFELCPSAENLQRCLDFVEVALDLFKEVDNVVFVAMASRWRSVIIYTGWARRWVAGDGALTALQDAEDAWAAERADMTALASFEAVSRRQHFTSLKGLRETYQRAFAVCHIEGRVAELWEWTQKAKARSLSDQLGIDSLVPAELREQITHDPARRELAEKEAALTKQIAESSPSVRLRLRGELDAIHRKMKQDDLLRAMMDIKNGTPVGMDQIQQLGAEMKKASPERDVKFVDWLERSGKFWVLVLGTEEKKPTIMECPISPLEVAAWKREWLDAPAGEVCAFAEDDFYSEDDPEFSLRALDGIVTPLSELTKPGDLLVFCPTGVLHSIPLHALFASGNTPIIARNPIIYSASLTTFWQCCRRSGRSSPQKDGLGQNSSSSATRWTLTSMLEESDDRSFDSREREDVYSLISNTAATSSGQATIGMNVTKQFLLEAMQDSSLFHFHGHGAFDRNILADQSLELSDGNITVREMFDMKLKAPHITLVACDSASQGIAAGDEPLGILTALLCAGAGSVLGTIWPTASRTGRYFTSEFYANVLEQEKHGADGLADGGEHAAIVDLAEVCQRASLSLRRRMDTWHPYHWGAFVLHGSWSMRQRRTNTEEVAG